MAKVPLQFGSGTPPEPKIGDSQFHTIEVSVRKFKACRDFSVGPEVREKISDAARWYCLRTFMNAEAAAVADVKRAMNQLIASAGKLEEKIALFTGPSNPDSAAISEYLSKHEFDDLGVLLTPLALFKLACERTIADVGTYQRKGPAPDDALDGLIWTLADIFNQRYTTPTTNWSASGRRNSPFMAFARGVYMSLPLIEKPLRLGAFQERAHRVIKKWSEEQGK